MRLAIVILLMLGISVQGVQAQSNQVRELSVSEVKEQVKALMLKEYTLRKQANDMYRVIAGNEKLAAGLDYDKNGHRRVTAETLARQEVIRFKNKKLQEDRMVLVKQYSKIKRETDKLVEKYRLEEWSIATRLEVRKSTGVLN